MTQPTAEAYEAASTAWLESSGGAKEAVRDAVDAVWPLAVEEGRKLERTRLASGGHTVGSPDTCPVCRPAVE